MKKLMYATVCIIVTLAMAACVTKPQGSSPSAAQQSSSKDDTTVSESSGGQVFTIDELAKYNGKDGAAAYVAVDGVVYDVTNHPKWRGGVHEGVAAGQDITDAIKNQSPHGVKELEGLTVVGTLKQ